MFPNQIALIHFLGVTVLASGVIAFFYTILAQHRFRAPVQGYFQRMAIGILLGVYGSVAIWVFDTVHELQKINLSSYLVDTWAGPLAIILGVFMVATAIRHLQHDAVAKEYRSAIRYLNIGILCSLAALIAVALMLFISFPILLILRGFFATMAFLFFATGAYGFRRIDVGGSLQLFMLVSYFVAASVMSYLGIQTNMHLEQRIINSNLPFIENFVQHEIDEHLTSAAFDMQNTQGEEEMQNFLETFAADNVRRVNIVYSDGYIAASDLARLTGAHPALTEEQQRALSQHEATLHLMTDQEQLPEWDRGLGSLYVARIPIDLQDGSGARGFAEIAYSAEVPKRTILSVQNDIFSILAVTGVLFFLAIIVLFVMLHKQILHPLAGLYEQLTRVEKAESTEDRDLGRRRIHMHANKTFERIAGEYNHFIELHEKQVGELKKQIRERHWKG
ncbi:MAG: hypothetical protein WCV86_04035 [Patescibacteria group bacterium]|jgi:hypothetical protein